MARNVPLLLALIIEAYNSFFFEPALQCFTVDEQLYDRFVPTNTLIL